MSMGVSPPPFHGGFSGLPGHLDPRRGGPWGAGARGSVAEDGTLGRGIRGAFPSLSLRAVSGGPVWVGGSPGWRGGPGRHLALLGALRGGRTHVRAAAPGAGGR